MTFVLEITQAVVLMGSESFRRVWFTSTKFVVAAGSEWMSALLLATCVAFCSLAVVLKEPCTVGARGSSGTELLTFNCEATVALPSTLMAVGGIVQLPRPPASV